jgi:nucleoside-diphosphate kinase
MVKPDGVARGLEYEVILRVERSGLRIVRRKALSLSTEQAAELYRPHLGKKFYSGLVKFITSGPVIACVVEGDNAISRLRKLMGDTDPLAAAPGTIRGDPREEEVINEEGIIKNLVHGSDEKESAEREMAIFFP